RRPEARTAHGAWLTRVTELRPSGGLTRTGSPTSLREHPIVRPARNRRQPHLLPASLLACPRVFTTSHCCGSRRCCVPAERRPQSIL
ncbi:hypothetical protein K466DRAFT_592987, partial [Polyporus arcularius HHB13444]